MPEKDWEALVASDERQNHSQTLNNVRYANALLEKAKARVAAQSRAKPKQS